MYAEKGELPSRRTKTCTKANGIFKILLNVQFDYVNLEKEEIEL